MTKEVILILDFGSPYTQLIAQRIRENHVFSQIVPYNIPAKEIKLLKPNGIILSGGGACVYQKKALLPEKAILKLDLPVLGVCYGARAIVQLAGGKAKSSKSSELQRQELFIDNARNMFWQMPGNITCLMSAGDYIKKLPGGFAKTAHTQEIPIAAFESPKKKIYGVVFHPEVVATQRGSQILSNFLYKVCGCIGTWTMDHFIKDTIAEIKKTAGSGKVVINLNGELDSSVAALLINKAVGKRLKCILINTGLLRSAEVKLIKKVFRSNFRLNLSYIDRSQRFLQSLKGVTDAEEKKRIIGESSVRLFEEEIKKSKGADYLALGTLYTEIIKPGGQRARNEGSRRRAGRQGRSSASGVSQKLKVLQPLKDLFNEEIKVVAKELGLPDAMVFRQPFPDEGLAVRIAGEVTAPRLKILQDADSCLVEAIKNAGLYEQVWQSFAVLIPPKNIIAIRCVASTNGITADWVRLPYDVLEKIARHILGKVKAVSRVVYDISPKPPVKIEWE
ncbi:MAG: glutamine-hydrolyzing GMP synthase [Candidatus Omnitrophota bacterium]